MKISIIIPTYNRGYIVGAALESLLKQTYRDFEILVVDDGSSDDTLDVIKNFKSDKIRWIQHEENKGCSAAYNTGIRNATGDVIGFLDSDDLWKSDYLERLVDSLDRHPEIDAAFSDVEIVNGAAVIPSLVGVLKSFPKLLAQNPGQEEYVLSAREMYVCMLEEVPIKPSAFLARRKLFDQAGLFNESWPSGTDWDLFLRFSRVSSFVFVNRPLVVQKWMPDATHHKYREEDKIFLLKVFHEESANLKADPEATRALNRGIVSHCNILGYIYLESGQRMRSLSIYWMAYRETGDAGMLVRAVSVLIPLALRDTVKKLYRRVHPDANANPTVKSAVWKVGAGKDLP